MEYTVKNLIWEIWSVIYFWFSLADLKFVWRGEGGVYDIKCAALDTRGFLGS